MSLSSRLTMAWRRIRRSAETRTPPAHFVDARACRLAFVSAHTKRPDTEQVLGGYFFVMWANEVVGGDLLAANGPPPQPPNHHNNKKPAKKNIAKSANSSPDRL